MARPRSKTRMHPANVITDIDDPAQLMSNITAVVAEIKRREWQADPALWVSEVCKGQVWSKQKAILESVRDNRYTVVQSAVGTGKTVTAAMAAAWFLCTHPPGYARVMSSASTWQQVKASLWTEIGKLHARGNLPGRVGQASWYITQPDGNEMLVAVGHRPADNNPNAMRGFHAQAVLIIFDEMQGINKELIAAALGNITSEQCRVLGIGNPETRLCEFYELCQPGSGWNHIKISAFDCPAFTGEVVSDEMAHSLTSPIFVDNALKRWGESHPFYQCQVLGEFPEVSDDALIPMEWVRRAIDMRIPDADPQPVELGMDVGGGVDKTVIIVRQGPYAKIHSVSQNFDTSIVKEELLAAINLYGASLARVDAIGIGRGAATQAAADGYPVESIQVSAAAKDKVSFGNLRAESYWHLRDLFQKKQISLPSGDLNCEDLVAQLVDMRYKRYGGRLFIETKQEMKSRGRNSPDLADALALAFLPQESKRKFRAVWGRKRTVSGAIITNTSTGT